MTSRFTKKGPWRLSGCWYPTGREPKNVVARGFNKVNHCCPWSGLKKFYSCWYSCWCSGTWLGWRWQKIQRRHQLGQCGWYASVSWARPAWYLFCHTPMCKVYSLKDALNQIGRNLEGTIKKGLVLNPSDTFKIDCYPIGHKTTNRIHIVCAVKLGMSFAWPTVKS